MKKTSTIIFFNGKFISAPAAKISMLSNSFRYGYGIFETIRTYNYVPFKAKEHVKRLLTSAKQILLAPKYTEAQILEQIAKIAAKSPHPSQRIRLTLIEEGLLITSIRLKEEKHLQKGVKCLTVHFMRSLPEIKSTSFLSSYLANKIATSENCYEAILLNEKEEIFEGAYSSIFWFENNTLYTRKDEVLPGITAQTVINLSPFPVKYKTITLSNLLKKQEIFLTQTTKGILPIIQINQTKIGPGSPGPKTQKLIELFKKTTSTLQ